MLKRKHRTQAPKKYEKTQEPKQYGKTQAQKQYAKTQAPKQYHCSPIFISIYTKNANTCKNGIIDNKVIN